MKKETELRRRFPESTETPTPPDSLFVGQWYWVAPYQKGEERWLGCVVRVGSNYAKLRSPGIRSYSSRRVHFDSFDDVCSLEKDPDSYIKTKVELQRAEVRRLLNEIKEVTARLSVAPHSSIAASGGDTQALAVRMTDLTFGDYKNALVKAKEKILPDLFKQVKEANEEMEKWLSAQIVPLQAQGDGLNSTISLINDRIFNVQLYAGLVEDVVEISGGEAAPNDTQVHLMQRRCYMDEECLARYETGGMEFENLADFDRWIAKFSNRDRLLPFPRCIVAFRIRREKKDRSSEEEEETGIRAYLKIMENIQKEKLDKLTFLYIRNGDRLYRMNTEIDFGERLFPDLDKREIGNKVWGKFDSRITDIISDEEYQGIMEDRAREKRKYKADLKAAKKKDRWAIHPPYYFDKYKPFHKSSVYYDDIAEAVGDKIKEHNRLALVLQGLLDRSTVLHPHPPWQLWTSEGFSAALKLVYDDSKAIAPLFKPDFEVYRAGLNASLKVGSITIGQHRAWALNEGRKEAARMDRSYRTRGNWRPTTHEPYGNPGPGKLAYVAGYVPHSGRCTFEWVRQRAPVYYRKWNAPTGPIKTKISLSISRLLNVSAYKPGDFKQFFADPRTRNEYLRWAPMLLEAEEYHAGNRKVGPEKPKD